jgi:hypothetical protein
MEHKQLLAMPIGMILLAIAILMERYLPANNILNFIEGLFTGLSIALNIYYVFVISRKAD